MGLNHSPLLITNGLVGCWDVGNPRSSPGVGTTWTDLSKNGNDGTLTNGPITAEGINQGIISFDGTDDTITTTFNPENIIGDANPYTICVWVKLNDNQTNADIFGSWYANNKRFYLSVMTGNYYWGLGDTYVSSTNTSAQTGVWQHVSLVFEGGSNNMLMYLDSEQTYNQSYSGNGDCPNELIPIGGVTLNAQASLAQIYNRALTAAEIKQNYNATKGRFSVTPSIVKENLVLHLDAGDSDSYPGAGTTWTDLSGNGHNATLYNGPTFSSSNGGEIILDGSNDYIVLTPSNMSPATTSGSIEFWFKIINIPSGSNGYLWYFDYNDNPEIRFYCDSSGEMYFRGYDHSVYQWTLSAGSIVQGQWHHIMGTFEDNNVRVYLDGDLKNSDSVSTFTMDNSLTHRIGTRDSSIEPLNCAVSVVRIYDSFIPHGQVLQNYEAQKGRFV